MKTYSVYIMSGKSRTLYTGVTSNLEGRVLEHKRKLIRGFTAKYNLGRLVYCRLLRLRQTLPSPNSHHVFPGEPVTQRSGERADLAAMVRVMLY